MSDSPYTSEPAPQHDREAALRRVNAPGIGLIVAGILYGLSIVASTAVGALTGGRLSTFDENGRRAFHDLGLEFLASPLLSIGSAVVGVAAAVIMVLGGIKMRALEGYGLAFAAAILTLVPCTCCCMLSMPFGIWALIVLLDANVKQSFR